MQTQVNTLSLPTSAPPIAMVRLPYFGKASAPTTFRTPVQQLVPTTSPTVRHRNLNYRFGDRLRELRRERNMTQLRMAVDFGIDRSFISDVERGKKSISLQMLEVIALGLKVELSELLHGL
jgi:DNA-binding XRE family transcriptional regulator